MSDSTAPDLSRLDTCSCIFEKTTPEQRRKIDRAIVDREPPTYRAIYKLFNLSAHGISFTAFYNYARRIRHHATIRHISELVLPDSRDLARALPDILAGFLVEKLQYADETSPAAIHQLTQAYKSALAARNLLEDEARKLRKSDAAELHSNIRRFLELEKIHLRTLKESSLAPQSESPAELHSEAPSARLQAAHSEIEQLREQVDRAREIFNRTGMNPDHFLGPPVPSAPEPPSEPGEVAVTQAKAASDILEQTVPHQQHDRNHQCAEPQ